MLSAHRGILQKTVLNRFIVFSSMVAILLSNVRFLLYLQKLFIFHSVIFTVGGAEWSVASYRWGVVYTTTRSRRNQWRRYSLRRHFWCYYWWTTVGRIVCHFDKRQWWWCHMSMIGQSLTSRAGRFQDLLFCRESNFSNLVSQSWSIQSK